MQKFERDNTNVKQTNLNSFPSYNKEKTRRLSFSQKSLPNVFFVILNQAIAYNTYEAVVKLFNS